MTDKQIIIDEQMENLNNLATQQLKRIEEEKKQIEHIAKTHLVETFDMQREIDKLKKELQAKEQECEDLKRQHQADKGLITSTGKMNYQLLQESDRLKEENEQLKNNDIFSVRYFKGKNDKLKQTLTEIKEIAKNGCYDDCGMPLDELSIILQKISEVEDGN